MKCSIIQDLLPLYVDGVVSEDTAQAVEEHLETCEDCRRSCDQMREQLTLAANEDLNQESAQALKSVKQTLKWKRVAIAAISAFITLTVVVSGHLVYHNVGVVHDFFDPCLWSEMRNNENSDWQPLPVTADFLGNESLEQFSFDSLFYVRNVVNSTDSDGPVTLRFRDTEGKVVLDNVKVQPGMAVSLTALHRFADYTVEVKTSADNVFLNFN